MRSDRFLGGFPAVAMALSAFAGCFLAPPNRTTSEGHAGTASGGSGLGGADGSGGTTVTASGSGGATDSGGAPGTGGNGSAGGGTGTGGTTGRGGTVGDGGAAGNGGAIGRGGATGNGGVPGNGGSAGRSGTGGTAGITATNCALGPSFKWSSTDALMDPVSDGTHKNLVAIREPTIVNLGSKYVLYATIVPPTGNLTIEATAFLDWSGASYATVYYLDNNSAFSGAYAAPQLMYHSGQKKWYLITQSNGPSYSTASDPMLTSTWTKPATFFSSKPSIVTQNAGSGPGWTDFWVICDSTNCHMFFANNNGYLFRSQTSLSSFPNGFGTPVQVMKGSSANDVYGGVSVYKVKGSSKYLLLVQAVGSSWSYIRSWTADALDGTWTALADTESNPFAGLANLTFTSSSWTKDVAQGELLRDGYDETMSINPCNMQYLYQGRNAYTTEPPASYPWKLGVATKTN
jgi:endo-1,4-beta-xylanase